MRLRPDESRVDEPDLAQALELAQADGEELPRLHVADDPLRRRCEVPGTSLAPVDRGLLRNAFGDVDPAPRRTRVSTNAAGVFRSPAGRLTSYASN